MLKIILQEEYGFRWWKWLYDGTKEELISDWIAGNAPLTCGANGLLGEFRGELIEVDLDEVEVHNMMPKYKDLWVAGDVLGARDIFNTKEYKELQKKFKGDFNAKWPINGHVFDLDDTYLIVDGIEYIPNGYGVKK